MDNRVMDYKGKGRLIVFEGVDGAGKTTMIKNVVKALEKRNIFPFLFRGPGGTSFGENVRDAIFKSGTEPCNLAVALAMMASHVQVFNEKAVPMVEDGSVIILDRFMESTMSYQGHDDSVKNIVKELIKMTVPSDFPVITFVIDIPIEVALERLSSRGVENFFDSKAVEFYTGIRTRLLSRMAELKEDGQQIHVVNNNVSFEDSLATAESIAEQIETSLFQK